MITKETAKVSDAKTSRQSGFTIIEVLITLSLAGLIMLVVFLAVPALQRNQRNATRKRDAGLLHAAVQECLTNNLYDWQFCNEPDEIPIDVSQFGAYTGIHFGASCTNWFNNDACTQSVPTLAEPNWLNHLICNNSLSLTETPISHEFVVGYIIETPGSEPFLDLVPAGQSGRCV